jgi:hypothetical protein
VRKLLRVEVRARRDIESAFRAGRWRRRNRQQRCTKERPQYMT